MTAIAVALVVGGVVDRAAAAPTGGDRLTKKQWIRSANKICRENDELIGNLDTPSGDPRQELTPKEFAEIADYTEAALDYFKTALADLRGLRAPAKDARKVKKILRPLTDAIAAFDDTATAARQQDRAAIEAAVREAAQLHDDFEAAATAYGSTCGRGTPA